MSQNTSETTQKQVMVGTRVWFDVDFKTFQLMISTKISICLEISLEPQWSVALKIHFNPYRTKPRVLFVWFDALHPSQQLWSCRDGLFN